MKVKAQQFFLSPPLVGTVLVLQRFILVIKIKFWSCGGATAAQKGPCCLLNTGLGNTCKYVVFKYGALNIKNGKLTKYFKKFESREQIGEFQE